MTKSLFCTVCLFALVGGTAVGVTSPLPAPRLDANALMAPTTLLAKNLTETPSLDRTPRG